MFINYPAAPHSRPYYESILSLVNSPEAFFNIQREPTIALLSKIPGRAALNPSVIDNPPSHDVLKFLGLVKPKNAPVIGQFSNHPRIWPHRAAKLS